MGLSKARKNEISVEAAADATRYFDEFFGSGAEEGTEFPQEWDALAVRQWAWDEDASAKNEPWWPVYETAVMVATDLMAGLARTAARKGLTLTVSRPI